jgi:hypothetical protein
MVAPLEAFCLRRNIAVGITPQEQSGNGTPKIAALITEKKLFLPKCRATKSFLKIMCKNPAKTNPKKR